MSSIGLLVFSSLFFSVLGYVVDEECGDSKHDDDHFDSLTGRIVGGVDAIPNEWPWQISMRMVHPKVTINHFCGGVLIDRQFVLTAAHCVKNALFATPETTLWRIRLGKHNIKKFEKESKNVSVSRISVYHLYQVGKYDYDIAVIKLKKKIRYSDAMEPACLPTPEMTFEDATCIASGWGKVDFDIPASAETLKEVELQVYDNQKCGKPYKENFKIDIQPWHLCAGTLVGGKGTCQGDSGGPLSCLHKGKWYVAGLTSFGPGCARPGFADVYTRVSYFHGWIQTIMATK